MTKTKKRNAENFQRPTSCCKPNYDQSSHNTFSRKAKFSISPLVLLFFIALTSLSYTATANTFNTPKQSPEPSDSWEFKPRNGGAIVHLFNFPFSDIRKDLKNIATTGFEYIQVSPPQLSRGDLEWWGRYQPLDYRILESPLGNEKDLKRLIDEAKRYNIGIIVDIVLNHTANLGKNNPLIYPPRWAQETYNISQVFSAENFNPNFCIKDYENRYEVLYGRLCNNSDPNDAGLPDLDLEQDYVINVHKDYLKKLIHMGVAGFRLDAVKHMQVDYFNRLLDEPIFKDRLIFGEVIADNTKYDRDLKPYLDGTSIDLMDFPLQKSMVDAFRYGSDIRVLLADQNSKRSLPKDRAVTFVINHDIPNNKGTFDYLILNKEDEILAHIFMFSRKGGIPHVYSDLGKADMLDSDRWKNYHTKKIITAGVKFYNETHDTDQRVLYSDKCLIVLERGSRGIATLNKCGFDVTLEFNDIKQRYEDLLSGAVLSSDLDSQSLVVKARTGQLFLSVE